MTTSLFAVLRIRFVSESEKVQDRGETTTRCRSQGGREIWVELVQRLSLSFEVGSRCDDIDAFASVSACRDSDKSSMFLCREGGGRDKTGDVSLSVVFLGLVGCRSWKIGNRDRSKVEKQLEFVLSSRSWRSLDSTFRFCFNF